MHRYVSPLLAFLSLPLWSADKKPFTLSDFYRVKSIRSLALSPDGSKVAFELSTPDLKKGKSSSQLWLLEVATKQVRTLTPVEQGASHPSWSQDGKHIYFTAHVKGASQLWSIGADGSQAKSLTRFGIGVDSPLALPNQKVVFTASVYPETLADAAKHQVLADKLANGPVQAHLADSLLYRHWNVYREFRYNHLFVENCATGTVEAITSGKVDFPSADFTAGTHRFDVSPDGKELCVTGNLDQDLARSTNHDLFLIDLQGDKKPRKITDNPAFDGDPQYSPDGRWIAYKIQSRPGYESDCYRLALYDRQQRKSEVLTQAIDNWVDQFQWSKDSKTLWFTVEERGREVLYNLDMATRRMQRMMEGHAFSLFAVTPDEKAVVFKKNKMGEPDEIWQYVFASKTLTCLTSLNQALFDEVDFRPAEEMWISGADGAPIHTFIIKPHGFDPAKKYPLIVNVHGGPQSMWKDTLRGDWQVYPGAGYIVAMPNPHGSTGYGQAFTEAISGDYDGKVMTDIDKVTSHLAALPYVDKDRMGAMGWSWGGYAMMWLEGHNKHFKALAAMMGICDWRSMQGATEELWFPEWDAKGTPWGNAAHYERISPCNYVKDFKTPCLIITGEKDYRIPYTQSLQFFTALQSMKVPSRLIVFKNDGHWPSPIKSMPVYYNAHLEWFEKYLGGGKAPWSTEDMIKNRAFDEQK